MHLLVIKLDHFWQNGWVVEMKNTLLLVNKLDHSLVGAPTFLDVRNKQGCLLDMGL